MKAVITTHDLTIGYRHPRQPPRVVVSGIDVTLYEGELVCLIGPNGAGKSTLMRTIAAMQPPLSGRVDLLGDDVQHLSPQQLARRLSVVLTERPEVGLLSAYALVALGRHPYTGWSGQLSSQDEEIVRWALESVQAAHLAARHVMELSDGERQKVMIARALAQEPALILLDEPTAFLDLPRRVEIIQVLRRLARVERRAVLLSTHDLDLALRSADRIWLLPHGGPLHSGSPEDLILNGTFESAFQSEGAHFDPQTGSFRLAQHSARKVMLMGTGLPAVWTRRALERHGFVLASPSESPSALLTIEVNGSLDTPCWHVRHGGGVRTFSTIHALLLGLDSMCH